MKQELTAEEMRSKTMELLGVDDASHLDYIDDAYANADANEMDLGDAPETEDENGVRCSAWYGHSMAYGSRNGRPTYEFLSTASCGQMSGVCLGTMRFWNYQHQVNHFSTGRRCNQSNNHSAVLEFRRR